MKKLFLVFLLLFLLTSCSNEKVVECTIDGAKQTIHYNNEKVVNAYENGNKLSKEEIKSINRSIVEYNNINDTSGVNSFMENEFIRVFELSGGTCIIED